MSAALADDGNVVDIEAFLDAFLADPARTTTELSMPATQRKHAKQIVERYPELECESYGFGQDRKLHFFKKYVLKRTKPRSATWSVIMQEKNASARGIERCALGCANQAELADEQPCDDSQTPQSKALSVKKKCIDDWGLLEAKGQTEAVMYRSMPLLRDNSLVGRADDGKADFDSARASTDATSCQVEDESCPRQASPDRSTVASSSSPQSTCREELSLVPLEEGLAPQQGLDTQLEMGSANQCVLEGKALGIFRHCLSEEALAEQVTSGRSMPPIPSSPVVACAKGPMPCVSPIGNASPPVVNGAHLRSSREAKVEIVGLLKKPAFSGLQTIAQGSDDCVAQCNVLFDPLAMGNPCLSRVKGENLVSARFVQKHGLIATLTDSEDESTSFEFSQSASEGLPSLPATPTLSDELHEQASWIRLTASA